MYTCTIGQSCCDRVDQFVCIRGVSGLWGLREGPLLNVMAVPLQVTINHPQVSSKNIEMTHQANALLPILYTITTGQLCHIGNV